MAAILGLSAQDVMAVCRDAAQSEVVEAVNFNTPDQTVIAGHVAAVDRACGLAKEKGAKRALPLAVSAPFHSSLLKPASDALREKLSGLSLGSPSMTIFNNVDVRHETESDRIKDSLARQAMSPVRWVEVIQALEAHGVKTVMECGPGKVLSGLVKKIAPSMTTFAINDQASLDAALSGWGQT
jgi:[acyl-carrier-protein] S-malonyltransferase